MARTRLARMAQAWRDDETTIVGRYYLYPDGVYKALTATTGVPPTGSTDANYELLPETPFPRKWSHPEADWATYAITASLVQASYAEIYDEDIGISSLGGAWTPIQNYQAEGFTPRNIATDLVAGTLQFPKQGIYAANINLFLQHNESNQGRTTQLRAYNVTDGTAGLPITIGIARNQPATTFSTVLLVPIDETGVDDAWRLEIGNGSSITITDGEVRYGAFQISEFRDY